jgi:dienelactone hydrolase
VGPRRPPPTGRSRAAAVGLVAALWSLAALTGVIGDVAGFRGFGGTGNPRAASAEPVSVPIAVTQLAIDDPARWTPARGNQPAHPGRSLPTTVWYPTTGGPWPLIVFAHGFNTNPNFYDGLVAPIAAAGYVVAAPEFPASGSDFPGAPSQADIPNQPGDLSVVVTAMLDANATGGGELTGRIDASRIGATGHSDGGTTVAALALNSATVDGRIRATAVLAGARWPIPNGVWGAFNGGPVLVVNGDADTVNWIGNGDSVYAAAAPPKAFVQAVGGGHLGPFINESPQGAATRASIIAFFDRELRGDVSARGRFYAAASTPGLTSVRASTIPYHALPIGALDGLTTGPGVMHLSGWALDEDTAASIPVAVYVDGVGVSWFPTDRSRPDIAAAFPGYGDAHGYAIDVAAPAGNHQVCVYGINTAYGDGNPAVGCQDTAVGGNPIGAFDAVGSGPGTITAAGWAIDPDTAASIPVAAYVDGIGVNWFAAAATRPDVGAAFPGYGPAHGFSLSFAAGGGPHSVCLYGINQGAGTGNPLLGCRSVTVGGDPIGVFDAAWSIPGAVTVAGWAIDPDTTGPTTLSIAVDGVVAATPLADATRGDVGAAFPGYGPAHGFRVNLSVPPGVHTVCITVIDQGYGANQTLGCRTVTVGGNPFGVLDSATATVGSIRVTGWTIDPDTTASIPIAIYVDGTGVSWFPADRSRPDVAQAAPGFGALHGFDVTFAWPSGAHSVCVYAINQGSGTGNPLLACAGVSVP